jgi:mRNA interferase RelE/StbE
MQERRLRVPADVAELIRNLHPVIKRKVKASLQRILKDPGAGKSLKDELEGLRSFRMGRIRIIYRLSGREIIEVVTIGPRKTIYEETLRLLKKRKVNRI